MVTAGITGGYLTNPRLREVHWQAGNRPAPGPQVSMQGEAAQFVDPSEIPAAADVARLGQALAAGRRGDLHELMANMAAYSGLRQGELFALSTGQIDPAARVIDVDRKVIEVSGKLLTGAPKGRKRRKTIYPARTPQSYPLAGDRRPHRGRRAERQAGANPLGLMFPSPRGTYWRSSNFDRRVLAPPTWRPAGATPPVTAPGPGTAAARAVHDRPVHLETRRHRRLGHGRARLRPHHPGHVHRHHRRRPGPRPHSHRITSQLRKSAGFNIEVRWQRRGHLVPPVIEYSFPLTTNNRTLRLIQAYDLPALTYVHTGP